MKQLFSLLLLYLIPVFSLAFPMGGELPYHKGNFKSLLSKAQKTDRYCLVEFYTTNCRVCTRLERETFADAEFRRFVSDKFVPYRLDGLSILDEGAELAQRYHIRAYPTLVVLDAKGRVLKTLEGYFTPTVLMAELEHLSSQSDFALFDAADLAREADRQKKVIRTTGNNTDVPRQTADAYSVFVSEYGLVVQEFDSYGAAHDFVRVWDVPWEGGIWILPSGHGHYKMVLGPINHKAKALEAQARLEKTHSLETELMDLSHMF